MPLIKKYEFDPTGTLPANRIPNEQQSLTPANGPDYRFLIPRVAPFFADTLKVKLITPTGLVKPLRDGIDYYTSHWFISASRACAKPIWGSVTILDNEVNGVIEFDYQTVGGDWVLTDAEYAEALANHTVNPRIISYEYIALRPYAFPVIDHPWDLADLVGAKDVVAGLKGIENQLRSNTTTGLADHIADHKNPHQVNKVQVGLGNVSNFPVATSIEAVDPGNASTYMTPAAVAVAINNQPTVPLERHIKDQTNPHKVTAAQVGAPTLVEFSDALSNKLDKAGVAADSSKLGGLTLPDLIAAVLTGKSADSGKFDGRTWADAVTQFRGVKVDNASTLNGRSVEDIVAAAQGGTSSNSLKLGGSSLAEIQTAWRADTVANATAVGGMTPADLQAAWRADTVANATTLDGKTLTEISTIIQGGTASNSTMFSGKTYQQVMSDAAAQSVADARALGGKTLDDIQAIWRADKVADSARLEGKTLTEVTEAWRGDTVDNAKKLNGQTPAELTTAVIAQTNTLYARQGVVKAVSGQVDPKWYVPLFKFNNTITGDMFLFVTNANKASDTNSSAYMLRCSNNATGELVFTTMLDVDSGTTFGFTNLGATTEIYAVTGPNHGDITVTPMNYQTGEFLSRAAASVPPVGFTPGKKSVSSDVTARLATLEANLELLAKTTADQFAKIATKLSTN